MLGGVKRVAVVVAIAVLGVGAVVVARCGRDGSAGGDGYAAGNGSGRARPRAGSAAIDQPLPAWAVARGAPARRIAGRVTFEGKPVEGAVVTLSTTLSSSGAAPALVRTTGPDGRFDFSIQPAAGYRIAAAAPDRTMTTALINLGDPTLKPPPDQLEAPTARLR